MGLAPGDRLGRYEILAPLGAGGMGEVYRARDTELERDVAIKVLAEAVAGDAGRLERFQREAKTISQLSHPHICTLFDVGHEGGVDFLVMEYLEGDSLADRLEKGKIPFDEALRLAAQIADALDAAHRRGVVHRDLKPGNIMVTRDGAKLLDFGLAKLHTPGAVVADSMLSTEDKPLTAEGTLLGTIQYMAPEQLEGKEADARSDVFAFGAVVYEMLTGRRAFEGSSHASLIAAIMFSEPPATAEFQPLTPPSLERVARRCLAKDPDQRWHSVHDVMVQLQWILEAAAEDEAAVPSRPGGWRLERFVWVGVAAVLAAMAIITAMTRAGREPTREGPVHFLVQPPEGVTFGNPWMQAPAISPGGRRLAFVASDESGRKLIWVRALDSVAAEPVAGTQGAAELFWSPDGQSIGYVDDVSQLRRVDLAHPSPQTICKDAFYGGASWNRDGVVLFVHRSRSLYRVPASGGMPSLVVPLDESRQDFALLSPQFLPDGRHFLFFVLSQDAAATGTYVGSLDSSERKLVLSNDLVALFAPPGYLLFVREETLLAQPLDAQHLVITGDPVPVAAPVGAADYFMGFFSVSGTGVLTYRPPTQSQLLWFDRGGARIGQMAAPEGSRNPELTPDGTRASFEVADRRGHRDIWIADLARQTTSRLTTGSLGGSDPVWSPDGRRIAFTAYNPGDQTGVYVADSRAAGEGQPIIRWKHCEDYPTSWAPDGRTIIVNRWCPGSRGDLWLLSLSGDPELRPLLATDFQEAGAQFSPNGRWVSYTSDESGRWEIYVRPTGGGAARWQVSDNGGLDARWRGDGKELFYLSPDRRLMSVEVNRGGPEFECGRPRPLFQTNAAGPFILGQRFNYDVTPDGERFLINTDTGGPDSSAIHVIVNWPALLER
jgi:Tol biopolymer transport system component